MQQRLLRVAQRQVLLAGRWQLHLPAWAQASPLAWMKQPARQLQAQTRLRLGLAQLPPQLPPKLARHRQARCWRLAQQRAQLLAPG